MNNVNLTDRVIVVTGAARGMGAEITRTLIARGANVVATDILEPQEPLDGAEFFRLDVTDEAGWEEVIGATVGRLGRLNGLVNNAGIAQHGLLVETSLDLFERTQRVNQIGTFLGMRTAAKAMAGQGGAIVNISSCIATRGVDNQFAYSASKWAVRGMTKCAAVELGSQGIRVNAVNPGPTKTPMIAGFPDDLLNSLQSMTPLGRLGESTDVASAVAFLLSDEASFVSGAELQVDGAIFA